MSLSYNPIKYLPYQSFSSFLIRQESDCLQHQAASALLSKPLENSCKCIISDFIILVYNMILSFLSWRKLMYVYVLLYLCAKIMYTYSIYKTRW